MAIEVDINGIETKPSDFKICKKCGALNWYENEECKDCDSEEFDTSTEAVLNWVEDEVEFWVKEEGYTEEQAYNVLVETN